LVRTVSEKPKVYFGSIQPGRDALFASLGAKLDKLIDLLDFSTIDKGDKVAVKMHLGYYDGCQTVPVFFVRRIVRAVKKVGGYPFITDNPTSVYNAVDRGYTPETCGCPLMPATGIKDRYTYPVKIGYRGVDVLDMSGVLHDADVLIDLAHSKGHGNCGYAGAVKNIAIGGYSAESRWHRIHGVEDSFPWWKPDKCSPEHAQRLVEACPYRALSYDAKKHQLSIEWFRCQNANCLECLKLDKKVHCLDIRPEAFAAFQELMVLTAKQILSGYEETKRFFLNVALQITPDCDCLGIIQPCVVPDIGILASHDIVAIEQATLDLIQEAGLIERSIPPYFKHTNRDSAAKVHPFTRLWGTMKNPYYITEYGEKHGLGTRKYELVEVLSPEETAKTIPPEHEYERQPTFY
jgi:uncharacterized Fe-S center protein